MVKIQILIVQQETHELVYMNRQNYLKRLKRLKDYKIIHESLLGGILPVLTISSLITYGSIAFVLMMELIQVV